MINGGLALTSGAPPYDIDGLCVLLQGGQVCNLAFFSTRVDLPKLGNVSMRMCLKPIRLGLISDAL